MTPIDLSSYADALKLKCVKDKDYVFCMIRRKYLVLQPEELVRQLLLVHMTRTCGYPASHIQVEKEIQVNELSKRFDIIVYDKALNPFLLVECKSHKIGINQNGLDQIGRYNITIKAPYLLLTNGVHYISAAINTDDGSYTIIPSLPTY